jgi:hypothetical protein
MWSGPFQTTLLPDEDVDAGREGDACGTGANAARNI